ncbi:phage integrase N-terminal SAM-like domain-containing protein [Oceanimonas baumannii]|uniref:phage integrase N-terminal SAM-like domain-containing protein n=1 Tax=Oceanimonas baumannii TaxID=129578 RepID=UPI003A9215A1
MTQSPFIEQIRRELRLRHYSLRTEKSYLYWIKGFILFHQKRHPKLMGAGEVKSYLSWLANQRHVAVNTQKQALCALVFLYNHILHQPLGELDFVRSARQRYLPVVLNKVEVQVILQHLKDIPKLVTQLLYGCGMRVNGGPMFWASIMPARPARWTRYRPNVSGRHSLPRQNSKESILTG